MMPLRLPVSAIFFFKDTATAEIYTHSLHDALPISIDAVVVMVAGARGPTAGGPTACGPTACGPTACGPTACGPDRKSTRLNSSHANISYAVFCLKKKKESQKATPLTLRHRRSRDLP